MNPKLMPTLMIVLSLAASIVYACCCDWRRSVYWAAGAVLNFAVTY